MARARPRVAAAYHLDNKSEEDNNRTDATLRSRRYLRALRGLALEHCAFRYCGGRVGPSRSKRGDVCLRYDGGH